jgi:hypothetical protein
VGLAFDGNTATYWQASTAAVPQWIAYDFGAGNRFAIVEVAIFPYSSGSYYPYAFSVQFSDDGLIWYTAWSVTYSQTYYWAASTWGIFNASAPLLWTPILETATATVSHYGSTAAISLTTSQVIVLSLRTKAGARNIMNLQGYSGSTYNFGGYYDLNSGQCSGNSGGTATMTYLGNGWYQCNLTYTQPFTGSSYFYILIGTGTLASPILTYTGIAGDGLNVESYLEYFINGVAQNPPANWQAYLTNVTL